MTLIRIINPRIVKETGKQQSVHTLPVMLTQNTIFTSALSRKAFYFFFTYKTQTQIYVLQKHNLHLNHY